MGLSEMIYNIMSLLKEGSFKRRINQMILSQEDGNLWLPLLDFVNNNYHASRELKDIATAKRVNPSEPKKVANAL